MQPAISVKGVSKQYRIGAREQADRALRETLIALAAAPFRCLGRIGQAPPPEELIWALKDVSFEVQPGEVVGVIGRNGAGKSTLLKILSHITEPTEGRIELRGRIVSLLEVGTGFHPELTGRENIYLNGTILGMKKTEIDQKFDEIVAFAETEKFLDTPVKHYSSGMYVRLAFAVAAHLDPEILLVDEVLSVGDAAFQKKCLGKMESVSKQGRTVFVVSHSIATIMSLCTRCMLLEQGSLTQDGKPSEVIALYQEGLTSKAEYAPEVAFALRNATGKAKITSVTMTPLGADGRPRPVLRVGYDMQIDVAIVAVEKVVEANVALVISEMSGYRVIDANIAMKNEFLNLQPGQEAHIRFILHNVLLRPDTYRLGLGIGRRAVEPIDIVPSAKVFTVEMNPDRMNYFQIFPGVYQCEFTHKLDIRERTGIKTDPAGIDQRDT
jgi:lipopolysaccharide transport system ATP-binding protein